jgi:hypothetical protein
MGFPPKPRLEGFRSECSEAQGRAPGTSSGRGSARLLSAMLLAGGLLAVACTLEEPEDRVYFDLEADPAWVGYSRVTIQLQDSLGLPLATLFDDSLESTDRLHRLPAGPYAGGSARIVIHGFGPDGRPLFRETRVYEGETQSVAAIDVFLGPFGTDSAAPAPVAPRPPVLAAVMADTTVSIRDSVSLWAQVTDADGDLAGWALDCDGDGKYEDSAAISGGRAEFKRGRRFMDTGSHGCGLRVRDRGGREVRGRLAVRVELDPPTADAGQDTTVTVGTLILLHARGVDRFGPVVSREWKIGSKPFVRVPQTETVEEAPATPQVIICILRITDSDALSTQDTLVVNVIPRTSPP